MDWPGTGGAFSQVALWLGKVRRERRDGLATGARHALSLHSMLPLQGPSHSLEVNTGVVGLRAGGLGGRCRLARVVAAIGGGVAVRVCSTRLHVAACGHHTKAALVPGERPCHTKAPRAGQHPCSAGGTRSQRCEPRWRCRGPTEAVAVLIHAGEVVKGAWAAVVDVRCAGRLAIHLQGGGGGGKWVLHITAGKLFAWLGGKRPQCFKRADAGLACGTRGAVVQALCATHRASALGAVWALPLRRVGAVGTA